MKGKGDVIYTVIGLYAPTEDATLEVKDEFYGKITEVLDGMGQRNEIIIMGDLNGRTGRRVKDEVVGRFGEDTINDNGLRLIRLCQQYEFIIQNGFFQHKQIHRFTWQQNTKGLRSIIGYVITKQESSIKILDVRVQRGAVCGSDHFLVKAKIDLKVRASGNRKELGEVQLQIKQPRYNIDRLKHSSNVFLYKLRLARKMTQPQVVTEQMYYQLKACINEAAKEALGEEETKRNGRKSYWWSEEIRGLVEEKKKLYLTWLSTSDVETSTQEMMLPGYKRSKEAKK
ncbi:craniofacial development protein 2-like [Homalodisca vitripennis]|uniref:craniofacial development protein 2-like n=1 Tax=Homalodisca vitripennis TaxID=197043 RepID=UPI001EEAE49D|nr:craniofacial development protein 2-like [Homalodisca vitripennis]